VNYLVALLIIVGVIIVFVVLFLSVITTNKAYKYEHKVDPLPEEPDENKNKGDRKSE
jgi:Na+-transporting methylmalonyl-CoA/oxaloacetate decarboxylase gamma subunit